MLEFIAFLILLLLGGILLYNNFTFFFYSALSEEEKSTLRAGLITNFNEPINQVSDKKKKES